jgi:hypothetical protein
MSVKAKLSCQSTCVGACLASSTGNVLINLFDIEPRSMFSGGLLTGSAAGSLRRGTRSSIDFLYGHAGVRKAFAFVTQAQQGLLFWSAEYNTSTEVVHGSAGNFWSVVPFA